MRVKLAVVVSAVGVLVGSALAIGALNSLYFRSFLIDTYDARLLATATSVRDVYAEALALGVSIGSFAGGQRVVDETLASNRDIEEIAVYESQGAQYVALPRPGVGLGEPLPTAWARAMQREPGAQFWPISDQRGFGVLVPIANTFNKTVGLIAFIQDARVIERPRQQFDRFLLESGLWITVPLAILLVPLAIWAVLPLVRLLPSWGRYAEEFAASVAAGRAPPEPPAPQGGDPLGELLAEPYRRLAARPPGGSAAR